MEHRAEVRDFLITRRAKITPQQAGLPVTGTRRVAGLRRSEVAALAGVSVEYYAKLERGSLAGVSAGVLEAIARALRLDDAERAHLLRLAQEANGSGALLRPNRRHRPWTVRPSLQWTLDAITSPAIVVNNRMDVVAANPLGRAMYADMFADPARQPNFGRFTFLDGAARRFHTDWDAAADMTVADLRTSAGKDPHDKGLHDLVGELSTLSDEFRHRWAAHNVRIHGTGIKTFRHHVVGELVLSYESMDLRADPDVALKIYAAEPGSPSAHALTLLASWAAMTGDGRAADQRSESTSMTNR
ncbi:helix-turn-helix transcriptional regulator [Actinoplanes palleronii]|uniref:Transcriptional regulator n=1 Tax=Actinoplanes palleronii TaxID=113570 RepID=A0ABQ4BJN2_9ACTN|nr:helix-turn-helix transcriptional regulator [Actinoplanes palleronii]GIE70883.1 transcriptional regulator [Actinoplanes palleronii]